MKVLICSNFYPPNFLGGAELIAHHHAKVLQDMGHDVQVFTGDTTEAGPRYSLSSETYQGLLVHRIQLTWEDFQVTFVNFAHPRVDERFAAVLDAFRPDVVHFHNLAGLSLGMIHVAKQRGIRTVLTVHDHWGFCLKNTLLKQGAEICRDHSQCHECLALVQDGDGKGIPIQVRKDYFAFRLNEVDHFISPSDYLARMYQTAGIGVDRFHVIPNGIDVSRFSKVTRTRSDRVRFSFIGFFGKHKGIHTIFEALEQLGGPGRLQLNLVGFGELQNEFQQLIERKRWTQGVRMWGRVDNTEMESVYAETDVLILPSIWPENHPVSITEAMACRIPVIASDLGGAAELVEHGKTGLLFEAGNPVALAKAMTTILENPSLISVLGERGYARILPHTFENQVKKMFQVYQSEPRPDTCRHDRHVRVACCGRKMHPSCAEAINSFSQCPDESRPRFFMADWLAEDDFQKMNIAWAVDECGWQDPLVKGLAHGSALLVPDSNEKLKQLCIESKCGLYYADAHEAGAVIQHLASDTALRRALSQGGQRYVKTKPDLTQFARSYSNTLSDGEFVEACYQKLLRRRSDLAGKEHYLKLLGTGRPRLALIDAFLSSEEFQCLDADTKLRLMAADEAFLSGSEEFPQPHCGAPSREAGSSRIEVSHG